MRRDHLIAIILWIAAIPCGAALMVAPEYLHLSGATQAAVFWSGVFVAAILFVLAIAIAVRGETQSAPKGHGRRMALIASAVVFGAIFIIYSIWAFVEKSAIFPEIAREFERVRTPLLGRALQPIEVTTDVYLAAHERAMVISLLPTLDVFVLPADHGRKAIRQHAANWLDDRKWFDDAYLRTLFHPPKDKKPPEYRVAELWAKNPEQWRWIGWREWSCPFYKDKFYYQIFENGIIIGVLPTSENLGSSQTFIVANSGEWSSSISSVEAPACSEKSATVNGVPIHGRFVK